MGQTVSYILRCICGEAEEEEKSDDEQNLLSYPLNSNSCSKSWIGSSSANNVAKHQFMFNHLDIQVSHEKAQSIDSLQQMGFRSIDQFKVTDSNIQVVEDKKQLHPPNNENVKTTKARSGEEHKEAKPRERVALLPKLTTTPSAVFQSIDQFKVTDSNIQVVEDKKQLHPPNNENLKTTKARSGEERKEAKPRERVALLPKLTTTPSAVFRSIDQFKVTDSYIQVVEDKKQLHPPNNENVKTTKARSGEERKEAKPRERVALLPKLTTTPSAVFRSIDQFKVTDSYIQVVEDKKQLHPPNNENVKTTKARSGEERKEAKPRERVALPVVIERKIKHYSSSQKILLVGEGDFSFSACLARAFGSASNIVATSLDSTEFLFANYKKAHSNISELMSRGAKVYHGVDATEMVYNYSLKYEIFDRIIYNFPLTGFFPNVSEKTELRRNRGLIVKFFKNAMELISEDGEIHIAHKSCGFFLKWNLPLLASNVGLRLIEEVPFHLKDYKGYNNKYGFGGDKNFDCKPSKTYKFGFETRKTAI